MTNKSQNLFLFTLLFVLLAVFLIHNFDSIGQDIGRHLKIGELIWQTKEIPKTNLFSFTEPDFAFANHHWLSEVLFFGIFSWTGFTGLILVKTTFVLLAFWLLFSVVKDRAKFWPLAISFLLSIFIFIQRTEVRPEFFSFAILAFFLWALFKAKDTARSNLKNPQGWTLQWLWFLPLAQLLWVNLHIYFFIGPFLLGAFLLDQLIKGSNLESPKRLDLGWLFLIFLLTCVATLINPNGLQGALLPFNILKEYGYSIVENQTLAFLASFFGFTWPIFVFKLSAGILIGSFILTIKKARQRIFEILISAFFIYAGFKMLRNLPLYALASFPVLAIFLTDVFKLNKNRPGAQGEAVGKSAIHLLENSRGDSSRAKAPTEKLLLSATSRGSRVGGMVDLPFGRVSLVFKILFSAFLIIMIGSVINGSFYKQTRSGKAFGLAVPNGLERAVNFVKENKIEGPMFNNFDIGGYLIWKLYPKEKVFVDNRPEAYSVEFFKEIYKPMQEDKEKWAEFSEKYAINFIFFGHTDATPWGQAFLKHIVKSPDWKIVYINDQAVILVKNNQKNMEIISRFSITEKNAVERTVGDSLVLSRFFYNVSWIEASVYFAQEAIKLTPKDPQPYLIKGLAHAYYTDKANQELAAENIKMAIDLGLKDSQYYYILGVVKMNLGQLKEAENLFIKALELDKNNQQAREFLVKYFKY
ncbi:MAG: hypothetical protein G01um101444_147 [Parcubacteria group bacterium Gr01-1014_44]|nr:MAG: hypothetical protein G01um101444_147 [Parcubacteria group bacterium Gr01-1014_44]